MKLNRFSMGLAVGNDELLPALIRDEKAFDRPTSLHRA